MSISRFISYFVILVCGCSIFTFASDEQADCSVAKVESVVGLPSHIGEKGGLRFISRDMFYVPASYGYMRCCVQDMVAIGSFSSIDNSYLIVQKFLHENVGKSKGSYNRFYMHFSVDPSYWVLNLPDEVLSKIILLTDSVKTKFMFAATCKKIYEIVYAERTRRENLIVKYINGCNEPSEDIVALGWLLSASYMPNPKFPSLSMATNEVVKAILQDSYVAPEGVYGDPIMEALNKSKGITNVQG